MINSYKQITGKYLRLNKKRTMLTLIGIILSVSLISAIGFFVKSLQETQIEDMKNTYGSWHIMYSQVDDSLVTKIKSNPTVVRSGTYTTGQINVINDKWRVREVYITDEALKLLPYKLKEGRFPEKSSEVVMEQWLYDQLKNGGKLGEQINFLGKEYKVVGILSDTYRTQYDGVGEIITKDKNHYQGQRVLLAELKVNRNLGKNINELKRLADKETVGENRQLIMVQGQRLPKGMIVILAVIIGIVIISTIAVIYNAFQISVVERVKQFGLLRAVGTTPKQIRSIILREATLLAVIGIPIGIGFGVLALYGIDIAFRIIAGENMVFSTLAISSEVVYASVLIGLLSIYISALLPAIFAGRISPLVAISSRHSITKEKLKKRKNVLVGRIFGFEGALAHKNIKRNRKRYRITVFSIIISVTLFITFTSFVDMTLNIYGENNESSNIHFSVVTTGGHDTEQKKLEEGLIDKINRLSYVDTSYRVYNPYYFDAVIDKSKENSDIKNIGVYRDVTYNGKNKTILYGSSLVVYDNESMKVAKNYLKEGNIDIDRVNKENGVIIIGKNRVYNPKTERTYYGPIANLKVGDEISLQLDDVLMSHEVGKEKVEFGKGNVKKVKVIAVLEDNPFNYRGSESTIKMITTKTVAKHLTNQEINPVALNIKIKDVNLEHQTKEAIEGIISNSDHLKLINIIDQNRTGKSVILMAKILLYGFVIVVSLIGSVNIINTLTTNIILRRREFATLKSIGLTQKGLRKMITLEGILYGIVGSIYGSIIGTGLSYLLFRGLSDIREQGYQLPISAIVIATLGAIGIGYLSVLAPLQRLKKDNLIDTIREDF